VKEVGFGLVRLEINFLVSSCTLFNITVIFLEMFWLERHVGPIQAGKTKKKAYI